MTESSDLMCLSCGSSIAGSKRRAILISADGLRLAVMVDAQYPREIRRPYVARGASALWIRDSIPWPEDFPPQELSQRTYRLYRDDGQVVEYREVPGV